MKAIHFYKSDQGEIAQAFFNWQSQWNDQFKDNLPPENTFVIIRASTIPEIITLLRKFNYRDCSFRKRGIELYRALKLDHKSDDATIPRLVYLNNTDAGSVKRMLQPFIQRFFNTDNPVCVIALGDEVFIQIAEFYRQAQPPEEPDRYDLTLRWAESLSGTPVVRELSQEIVGNSPSLKIIRAMISILGKRPRPVLILGASGTGKELIATQLVRFALTHRKPFIAVNCSTIPPELMDSELFGHVKGAFTGANTDRAGLFEAANHGTIFLDEIGDLPLTTQAKLLRVIGQGEIRRVGSNEIKHVDVRVIAATNKDIHEMIQLEQFRSDLYFRLSNYVIYTRPLADFPDDIPLIASYIWKHVLCNATPLSPDFLERLKSMEWPGNVRQLQSALDLIIDLFPHAPETEDQIRLWTQMIQNHWSENNWKKPLSYAEVMHEESLKRIFQSHAIIRRIKKCCRPLINCNHHPRLSQAESEQIRKTVVLELVRLDEMLLEPVFYKTIELYDAIRHFRFDLYNICQAWPKSPVQFRTRWNSEIQDQYKKILGMIFDGFWPGNSHPDL